MCIFKSPWRTTELDCSFILILGSLDSVSPFFSIKLIYGTANSLSIYCRNPVDIICMPTTADLRRLLWWPQEKWLPASWHVYVTLEYNAKGGGQGWSAAGGNRAWAVGFAGGCRCKLRNGNDWNSIWSQRGTEREEAGTEQEFAPGFCFINWKAKREDGSEWI